MIKRERHNISKVGLNELRYLKNSHNSENSQTDLRRSLVHLSKKSMEIKDER